ncbi:MAG: hypothetical protein QME32_02610 [Endomicrobiia bacterium]|nr:hypothetical protein [Endomicrobiia bacterium]
MTSAQLRFIVGIILLLSNQLVGWGGMLLFGNLARKTGRRMYYFLGVAVYAVSWAMLMVGVYLVGRERARAVMRYIPAWAVALAAAIAAVSYYFWKKRPKKSSADKDEFRS